MDKREALRAKIVIEARGWVGTPFAHQAATRGAGCDCVGLIRGVAQAVGISPVTADEWSYIGAYGRLPRPDAMGAQMRRFLAPIKGAALPGDIAWIAWKKGLPMHLALIGSDETGRQTLIHSYELVGKVVEHGFVDPWPGYVVSFWRFPALQHRQKKR